MFLRVKLTNFRQHTSREFTFGPGMNGIRGANEAGKTALLMAIRYLLLGPAGLGRPIAAVVTWGQPESSMRVEGEFVLRGVKYTAYRSTSGAEITGNGATVTGKTETVRFVEELFGASSKVLMEVVFSRQKAMSDILRDQAKATKLIETLADSAVIDRAVLAIQAELPTGSEKVEISRLSDAQKALEAWVEPPRLGENDSKILEGLTLEYQNAKNNRSKAEEESRLLMGAAVRYNLAAAQLEVALQRLKTTQDFHAATAKLLEDTQRQRAALPDMQQLEASSAALQQQLNVLTEAAASVDKYAAFQRVQAMQAPFGGFVASGPMLPEEELESELRGAKDRAADLTAQAAEIDAALGQLKLDIRTAEVQRITQTACGLCGKDLTAVPEVVEKNAQLDAMIAKARQKEAGLKEKKAKLVAAYEETEGNRAALQELLDWYRNVFLAQAAPLMAAGVIRVVHQEPAVLPEKIEWAGVIPDSKALAAQRSEVNSELTAVMRKVEAVAGLESQLVTIRQQLERFGPELARHQQDAKDAAQAVSELDATAADKHAALVADAERLQQLEDAAAAKVAEEQRRQQVVQSGADRQDQQKLALQSTVEKCRENLEELAGNNEILNRLRELKPKINASTWSLVLTSVSKQFSDMRGMPTIVTRSDDEFLANGKPVADLSGAAEDLLALALRASLLRIFVPAANMMTLDEPAAACDAEREAALLGVIASLGLEQTIVVSHSDVLDSVVSNLVEI